MNQTILQTSLNLPLDKQSKTQYIVKSLKICTLADQNFKYTDTVLNYWAVEIEKDYPNLEQEKLKEIIKNGSKGAYGKYYSINLSIVYEWIKAATKSKMVF